MSSGQAPAHAGRAEVVTVYVIGLFQGLSLVAFPSCGDDPHL